MTEKKDQTPFDIPETEEDLKSVAREASRILKEGFESFKDDFENFDKNHKEKRKKLFDGIRKPRRRTGGRTI